MRNSLVSNEYRISTRGDESEKDSQRLSSFKYQNLLSFSSKDDFSFNASFEKYDSIKAESQPRRSIDSNSHLPVPLVYLIEETDIEEEPLQPIQ